MQVSATPFETAGAPGTVPDVLQRVWATPLLRLQRSGDGRVWLKHEGGVPSGAFFDRVVRHRFAAERPRAIVVPGADAFAYAVALRAVPLGVPVTVIDTKTNAKRLRTLLAGAGARVRQVADVPAVASRVAEAVSNGQACWRRDDAPQATRSAYQELAREVRAGLGTRPSGWVVPAFGLTHAELVEALDAGVARVVALDDDGEARRALDGSAACRRQQVAHREGVLLSPLGAEAVDAAVGLADDVSGAVVAVVPEDGRRFVGWW